MVNQTLYALGFATKAYEYFTDFFQIPDVVPKAGISLILNLGQTLMLSTCIFEPLRDKTNRLNPEKSPLLLHIMLTCPCNFDPVIPHFYNSKTVVYRGIHYFLIFALKT